MIGCVDSGRPLYFGQNVPLQNIWRLALQGRGYEQIDRIDETGAELAGQRVRDAVDLRAQPHGHEGPAGTRIDVRATEKILGCQGHPIGNGVARSMCTSGKRMPGDAGRWRGVRRGAMPA